MMDHYLFIMSLVFIASVAGNIYFIRRVEELEKELEKREGGDDEDEKGE